MSGKNKCKILKEIRQKIAEENDIEFITSECKYQGSCSGTCPKCEEELRYLENELKKRQRLGKGIAIAGTGIALILAANAGKNALEDWADEQFDYHTGFFQPNAYMDYKPDTEENSEDFIVYNL